MQPHYKFSATEVTRFFKDISKQWAGETKVNIAGVDWLIATYIFRTSIVSNATMVEAGNIGYSFEMFNTSNQVQLLRSHRPAKCTEALLKNLHFKALAAMDEKAEAGILPSRKKSIEVGQVIFTHGYENERRRAVYKITNDRFGRQYHTVMLDGSGFEIDSFIAPYGERLGIGVYYQEGDVISGDRLVDLIALAKEWQVQDNARMEVQKQIDNEQKCAIESYYSQYEKADRRQTTNIIKRHIKTTWPSVQKIEIKSDVFSMGDSIDVRYYAMDNIPELESFVKSLQEGHFNSMEDIYEYDSNKAKVVLEGQIPQTYKYASWHLVKIDADDIEETRVTTPSPTEEKFEPIDVTKPISGNIEIVDYSEKAIAVFGETKPIKDKLKEIGGRFNPNLTHPGTGNRLAGWIFSKTKRDQLNKL